MADTQKRNPKYSMIIISKNRKKMVTIFFGIMFLLFTILTNNLITYHHDWKSIIVPILFLGLMSLFVPPSEVWNYVPWQDRPERKEKIVFRSEKKP